MAFLDIPMVFVRMEVVEQNMLLLVLRCAVRPLCLSPTPNGHDAGFRRLTSRAAQAIRSN